MPIHFCIVYDSFHGTMAELSSCDRQYDPQSPKCLLSAPSQKKFSTSDRDKEGARISNSLGLTETKQCMGSTRELQEGSW